MLTATILINTYVPQVQEISDVTQKSCPADSFCPQRHLRQVLHAKSRTWKKTSTHQNNILTTTGMIVAKYEELSNCCRSWTFKGQIIQPLPQPGKPGTRPDCSDSSLSKLNFFHLKCMKFNWKRIVYVWKKKIIFQHLKYCPYNYFSLKQKQK